MYPGCRLSCTVFQKTHEPQHTRSAIILHFDEDIGKGCSHAPQKITFSCTKITRSSLKDMYLCLSYMPQCRRIPLQSYHTYTWTSLGRRNPSTPRTNRSRALACKCRSLAPSSSMRIRPTFRSYISSTLCPPRVKTKKRRLTTTSGRISSTILTKLRSISARAAQYTGPR